MTGIIFRGLEQDNFSIMRFYVARANRIIPALAFLCVCLLIFGWFYLIPIDYLALGKHVGSSIGFLSNIVYWRESGYFDVASKEKWLLHTWSLSVEWQFYIIYPLLLVAMKRLMSIKAMKSCIVLGTIVGFIGCIIATYKWPHAAYYLLPTRAWEMMLGGIAYLFPWNLSDNRKKAIEWVGLSLILISYIFISEDNPWPGYLALLPVIGAYFVIQAHNEHSVFAKNKLLQYIGTWSYSIYLWHWPLVVAIYYFSLQKNFMYAGLLLSIACGYLSHKYIESLKFHYLKPYFKCKPICIILVAGVLGSGVFLISNTLGYYPEEAQMLFKSRSKDHMSKGGCILNDTNQYKCPDDIDVKAILLGDSHAQSMGLSLSKAMGSEKNIINLAKSGCFTVKNYYLPDDDSCGKHVAKSLKILEGYDGIPVFVDNRFGQYILGKNEPHKPKPIPKIPKIAHLHHRNAEYQKVMIQAYKESLCHIALNHPVYLMEQTPELKLKVPKEMLKSFFYKERKKRVKISLNEYNQRNSLFYKIAKELKKECNITLISTKHLFCDDQFCYGDYQGKPLYFDDDHLNEYGASRITPIFKEIMSHYP